MLLFRSVRRLCSYWAFQRGVVSLCREMIHLWRWAHRFALDALAVTEGLPLISILFLLSFRVARPIEVWPFWRMMRTMSPDSMPCSLLGPVLWAGGVV